MLDYYDLEGVQFNGAMDSCIIAGLAQSNDWIDIAVGDTTKYNYSEDKHSIELFLADISAATISQLHLARNRRYIARYTLSNGREFLFGYDAGAQVNYTLLTEDGAGAMITITAQSAYPLFEIQQSVMPANDWILATGVWNNSGHWYNNQIWN